MRGDQADVIGTWQAEVWSKRGQLLAEFPRETLSVGQNTPTLSLSSIPTKVVFFHRILTLPTWQSTRSSLTLSAYFQSFTNRKEASHTRVFRNLTFSEIKLTQPTTHQP